MLFYCHDIFSIDKAEGICYYWSKWLRVVFIGEMLFYGHDKK